METLLTQREAAMSLRLSVRTLKRMRVAGNGPRFVKCNRSIRYQQCDLDQWIASRVVRSTSEAMAEGRVAQ
jgi:predicted DNA-binding transcriptional regulator AlpA